MLHINRDEMQMVSHAAEVLADRIHQEPDEYTTADRRAVDHIEQIGKASTPALVITGDEQSTEDTRKLMKQIVATELKHWVPNASQRLLWRASWALNVPIGMLPPTVPDCGAEPGWHALTADWVTGMFVRRCVTCQRIFADGTPE